jgi:hypothetical protein
VAEQLALQQVLLQGGAVDGDEGPVLAAAVAVDGAGDELLAVPLSPRTSTVVSVPATFSISWRTLRVAGLSPTMW